MEAQTGDWCSRYLEWEEERRGREGKRGPRLVRVHFVVWLVSHVNIAIKMYWLKNHCLSKKNRAVSISRVYTSYIYFYSNKTKVVYAEINVTVSARSKRWAWWSGRSRISEPERSIPRVSNHKEPFLPRVWRGKARDQFLESRGGLQAEGPSQVLCRVSNTWKEWK